MKPFLQRWLIVTVSVLVAANVIKGIDYQSFASLLVASLLLGILNAFLKPIMLFFALPLLIHTFGLFTWVINAFLLYVVGSVVKGFQVSSFWSALWGALIISLVTMALNVLTGTRDPSFQVRWHKRRQSRRPPSDPQRPTIDV